MKDKACMVQREKHGWYLERETGEILYKIGENVNMCGERGGEEFVVSFI